MAILIIHRGMIRYSEMLLGVCLQ